ncbi:sensor histidine kinase [Streptosporangium sp. NPDC000396]|uniref:sensor histidine kinase n=1 Tax=Streptosporangium sp. NPDC000396 TaxID=3366185 RepID=UPI003673C217
MSEPPPPVIGPHSQRSQPPAPTGAPVWDGPPPSYSASLQRSPLKRIKGLPGKLSIRWRLTLTYGTMFFVAGSLLLTVMYLLLRSVLSDVRFSLEVPAGTPDTLVEIWQHQIEIQVTKLDEQILRLMVQQSALVLLGVGIFALLFGYLVAERALRPVAKMTTTARKLSESTLAHQRIDLQGPDDELKELADTFDSMLTRLNLGFDSQRRFVANASHELRTPLTINRTVLEIALSDPEASADLQALGRTLLEVNARNEKLIEGLLLLARSERELAVRKPVDVNDVAKTAVEQLTPMAERHGVTIVTDLAGAPAQGDPVLLERSVSNLVENAIKYNLPESGKVWIRTGILENSLIVQVANTGQHVPAYEVNSLFEPFRRLHADRVDSANGSGLGLSIVRAVVRAHGGDVTAVPRDGGGLVVTIRLPER